jgi:peptidyl-prolyl cis-trans isomerase C
MASGKKIMGALALAFFLTMAQTALADEKKQKDTAAADEKQQKDTPAADEKQKKGDVATVNGTAISRQNFDKEIDSFRQRLLMQGQQVGDDQLQEFQKDVLENLINRELLVQQARKTGVKVEESAINGQMDGLKQRFPNDEAFQGALKQMGISETELRGNIEQQLSVQQLIEKEISSKITISDTDAKAFYDSHIEEFKKPEEVKASHILVKSDAKDEEAQKQAAQKKIEGIQEKLKKGDDFAALAKESSDCPSKASGGDLGFFSRGKMVKPFEDAAFALKVGEMSGIVETQFGYHIIKVTDKKSESTPGYDEMKEDIEKYLKKEKVGAAVDAYIEELKGTAKIERFI